MYVACTGLASEWLSSGQQEERQQKMIIKKKPYLKNILHNCSFGLMEIRTKSTQVDIELNKLIRRLN